MQWWGWLILGAVLLSAEMFVLDAQFYLVFLGVSAALVGLGGLMGISMPEWAEWLAFAVFSLITMVAFRQRLYALVRNRTGVVEERLTLGDRVTVPIRLEAGQTCRVDHRGSTWTARNADRQVIEAGSEAVIVQVEGLTLHIKVGASV
jgi:membrane protein implicated in regulation of membrane protease activity